MPASEMLSGNSVATAPGVHGRIDMIVNNAGLMPLLRSNWSCPTLSRRTTWRLEMKMPRLHNSVTGRGTVI